MTLRARLRLPLALLGVAVLPVAVCSPAVAAPDSGEVLVIWTLVEQDTRVTAELQIRNLTPQVLTDWDVTVPFPHDVTDVRGAVSVQDDDTLTLSSEAALLPGHTRKVTLSVLAAQPDGLVPDSCTVTGASCRVAEPETAPEPSAEPSPTPSAEPVEPARLELSYRVVDDWLLGQNVLVTVRNAGAAETSSWAVHLPTGGIPTAMSNAVSTSGSGVVRAGNAPWNGSLASGETTRFRFTAEPRPEPARCTAEVDGMDASCDLVVLPSREPSGLSLWSAWQL